MAISLTKVFAGISDYVTQHQNNYTTIETEINSILTTISGSGSTAVVPTGLREIFDRNGVIGIGSFQLTDQTVVADNLTIPAGSAWMNLAFVTQASSTILDTSSLTTGTRYLDIDSAGTLSLETSSSVNSLYSFAWDSGTKVISSTTLLVDILFDGDDYNDSLDSTVLATSYTSMADRFEAIESTIGVLENMYAEDTGSHSGLNFGYKAGVVRNDNVVADTAASTIACTDAVANYIEVNPTTGVVTKNTSGFTSLLIPLFIVTPSTTVAGGTVTDRRTWASLGGGGGGGGHTQNTDTGTSSTSFILNNTEAGTPSANCQLTVERGTSANVGIRWNESADQWEQTVDGTTWTVLGAPDLGVQELSKFVSLEDPPAVVDLTATSSTSGYTQVDLTSTSPFSTIPNGVQGMLLRIQLDDATPSASTVVKIRKIEDFSTSPAESMRVFARDSADVDDKEASVILTPGQGFTVGSVRKIGFEYELTASAASAANLKIFVLGYWEAGVGTVDQAFSSTGNVVAGSSTVNFNLTGFVNRGLVNKITITETTGTPTAVYHVKVFDKDTFLAADLRYHVTDIDPASDFLDRRVIMMKDKDDTAELHIQIQNTDQNTDASSGTFDIVMEVERLD
jgi:hypothetical protein